MASSNVKTFFNIAMGFLMLLAVVGPIYTFFYWKRTTYLHKMHTEGIETTATIDSARVKTTLNSGNYYFLDLSWVDNQGIKHQVKNTNPTSNYARTFVSNGGLAFILTANTLPIKYLAADPAQFILVDDPHNSEAGRETGMQWSLIVSATGLGGAFLYFLPRYFARRRNDETA
jgi:hypothetical protein